MCTVNLLNQVIVNITFHNGFFLNKITCSQFFCCKLNDVWGDTKGCKCAKSLISFEIKQHIISLKTKARSNGNKTA